MRNFYFLMVCIFACFHTGPVFAAAANAKKPHAESPKTTKEAKLMDLPAVLPTKSIYIKNGGAVKLTASYVREKINGSWVRRLAYNQMIPGPILTVTQNSNFQLKLVNRTGAPTTLHSHGLRVDDRNDGVPGIGQQPIADGESFTYNLKVPDAGIYWYHPHMREEWSQHLGLYGNFWVLASDPLALAPVSREEVIVVNDLLLKNGALPFPKEGEVTYALMGRYGNQLLINNKTNYQLSAKQGDVIRFFMTNAANARPFRLKFNGARMKLVGADASLYEQETMVDNVTLGPAERVIVDVYFPKVGNINIENATPDGVKTMGIVKVSAPHGKNRAPSTDQFETLTKHDNVTAEMKPVRALLEAKPAYTLELDATVTGPNADHVMASDPDHGGIEWEDSMPEMGETMTGKYVTWRVIDKDSGKENMDVQMVFEQNVPAKVRIANVGKHHPMQHPIHFHGQRFAVLTKDGKPEANLVWKDTILVPSGSTYDIVLDNQNPGRWMGHCHIAEHMAVGMMFGFEVKARPGR